MVGPVAAFANRHIFTHKSSHTLPTHTQTHPCPTPPHSPIYSPTTHLPPHLSGAHQRRSRPHQQRPTDAPGGPCSTQHAPAHIHTHMHTHARCRHLFPLALLACKSCLSHLCSAGACQQRNRRRQQQPPDASRRACRAEHSGLNAACYRGHASPCAWGGGAAPHPIGHAATAHHTGGQ